MSPITLRMPSMDPRPAPAWCVAWLLLFFTAAATAAPPLFEADDHLSLTIEIPMATLQRDAEERPKLKGRVRYRSEGGETTVIPVTVSTRGRSRLENCTFPPLSLRFKRKHVKGTVFEGQRKLKLVTHCRRSARYDRYVHQEYGIYRGYGTLTDRSFRVRMLDVTYEDTQGRQKPSSHPAFFIEHANAAAARLGRQKLRVERIRPEQLDAGSANLIDLFQFMIGNTDWSMLAGPPSEGCCHNGKVLIAAGTESGWIVLPYDFDQAGIINTQYAAPAPTLGLRSVRDRLYRGLCMTLGALDENMALLNERRTALEAAMLPAELKGFPRRAALRYVDDFYEIVNDPRRRQRLIERQCLGPDA